MRVDGGADVGWADGGWANRGGDVDEEEEDEEEDDDDVEEDEDGFGMTTVGRSNIVGERSKSWCKMKQVGTRWNKMKQNGTRYRTRRTVMPTRRQEIPPE